jgi:hypothetical protein
VTSPISEQIAFLTGFRADIIGYHHGNGDAEVRSRINKGKARAQQLVEEAGAFSFIALAPPPALGGMAVPRANPFNFILDSYYGITLIPQVADMVEAAIGCMESPNYSPRLVKGSGASTPQQQLGQRASGTSAEPIDGNASGNFLDRAKRHPLSAALILIIAASGTTWAVQNSLIVGPRDFEITRLTRALDERAHIGPRQAGDGDEAAGDTWLVALGGATTWLPGNKPTILLQGQLIVEPSELYSGLNRATLATRIGTVAETLSHVPRGTRRTFTIGNHSYYLTVVDFVFDSIALRIDRRLIP